MKKVLFTATVDSHILHFHLPYLKMFKENGYEVHVATNGNDEIPYCDVKHTVSFERSPFKLNNIKAIKQLRKIINEEKFEIIHTHTPMGSVVTRIAARKARKNGTRVIYTAHGFHFFKGAPIINWMLFYPIEKILSYITDDLITINHEDYELAKKKFHAQNIHFVPGVGVDPKKFDFEMTEQEKIELRESLGLKKEDFVMIYVAELIKRKNQSMAIKVMNELVKDNKNIKLLLVGKDSLNEKYQKEVKDLHLEDNVIFTGYRKDIPKLMKISDLAISTSRQEGLPVNLIEAQMCGLPIVATNCRGNRDLLINGKNGFIVDIDNNEQMCKLISNNINDNKFNIANTELSEEYKLDYIIKKMIKIYRLDDKRTKLAIITSGFLPVPATKGGAAENLIDIILDKNEKYNRIRPCVFSIFDSESLREKNKYSNSDFIFIKPNFLASCLDRFNYFVIDKIIKSKNSRKFRYFFQRIDFLYKCSKYLKKYNFDKVLLENHTILYLCLKFNKNYIKYEDKYYYHCHNVVPSKFHMNEIISNTHKFISVSKFRNKYVEEYFKVKSDKCKKVLNCCSNDIYIEANIKDIDELKTKYVINKEKVILYVGRVDKDKGVLELIKACNKIKELKFKLLIVGAPIFNTGITTEYENKVKDEVLKSNNKYIMAGYVPHSELYKYYNLANVVSIPSQVEDSAPLVVIESLVSGKPIIATDCGGIPEYTNSNCSILIKKDNSYIDNFALGLKKILTDDRLALKMSKESLKQSERYSPEKYYNDFINEIDK